MESIVAGFEGVIVSLDDVMVSGRTQEERYIRLQVLLARFEEHNILLNNNNVLILRGV